MQIQFQVKSDGAYFIIDTETLEFFRLTKPLIAATDEIESVEHGKLIPFGPGAFSLEGRKPDSKGPEVKPGEDGSVEAQVPYGAGLSAVGVLTAGIGTVLTVYLRANVEVQNMSMPHPIDEIRYEILPSPRSVAQRAVDAQVPVPAAGEHQHGPECVNGSCGTATEAEELNNAIEDVLNTDSKAEITPDAGEGVPSAQ